MVDKMDIIKFQFDYIEKIREINLKLPFFQIPKYIIVKDIIVFLSDDDIKALGQTCILFQALIYTPFTFQILLVIRVMNQSGNLQYNPQTPTPILNYMNFKMEDIKKAGENNEDLLIQLETLRSVKEFLTNKIRTLDEIIKSHQKEIQYLKNEVNQGFILNEKNMKKILALENRIKAYEVDKDDHDEEIRNLNLQYQKLVSNVNTFVG